MTPTTAVPPIRGTPLFSSLHGRDRRGRGGIHKSDLRAAIQHGVKEHGGKDATTGAPVWKYTFANAVYITDETSTREITSYPEPALIHLATLTAAQIAGHAEAKRRLKTDPSQCTSHTVLVVDHSGSMRASDVQDFPTRSKAVFGMLALELVCKNWAAGAVKETDVVSLVLMNNSATVAFEREPMGLALYNKLVGLHNRGTPNSHGNYKPALTKAQELLMPDLHNPGCALSLIFLSDGRPSDWHTDPYECGDEAARHAQLVRWYVNPNIGGEKATRDKLARQVSALAGPFGQQLSVSTLGFAKEDQDFLVLAVMAQAARDAGAGGDFFRVGLSAQGLSQSITRSVSTLTATKSRLAATRIHRRQPLDLRRAEKEDADACWEPQAPTTWSMGDGWTVYAEGLARSEFSPDPTHRSGRDPWISVGFLSGAAANCIAIRKKALGVGSDRLVFGLQEYDSNTGSFVGPKLVAKESKSLGGGCHKTGFNYAFAKTRRMAERVAEKFNKMVAERLSLVMPDCYRKANILDISFLPCHVYTFVEEGGTKRGVLVEKMLEPAGRFTKWCNSTSDHEAISRQSAPSASFTLGVPLTLGVPTIESERHRTPQETGAMIECIGDEKKSPDQRRQGNQDGSAARNDDTAGAAGAPMSSARTSLSGPPGVERPHTHIHGSLGACAVVDRNNGDIPGRNMPSKPLSGPHQPPSKRACIAGRMGGKCDTRAALPFAPRPECYLQAFSHYSYIFSRRRMLVCDLQGVVSYRGDGGGLRGSFELTDPTIHYTSASGRSNVYGKSDLGTRGVYSWLASHRCNDICRLLGISGHRSLRADVDGCSAVGAFFKYT